MGRYSSWGWWSSLVVASAYRWNPYSCLCYYTCLVVVASYRTQAKRNQTKHFSITAVQSHDSIRVVLVNPGGQPSRYLCFWKPGTCWIDEFLTPPTPQIPGYLFKIYTYTYPKSTQVLTEVFSKKDPPHLSYALVPWRLTLPLVNHIKNARN